MGREPEDWAAALDRLLEGDAQACLKVSRLVGGLLAQWRAYDFRDEWPDVIQEVLLAVTMAARDGKIRDRKATGAYIRSVAHYKYMNHLRRRLGRKEDQPLPWEEATEATEWEPGGFESGADVSAEVRLALAKLPGHVARIVFGVYGQGKTYEQVAKETGTPLGTLKRHLRDGLAELRAQFGEEIAEEMALP